MKLLEKQQKPKIEIPEDDKEVCRYDNNTLICGKIKEVDYLTRIESKMSYEPFYGDIDLFGF